MSFVERRPRGLATPPQALLALLPTALKNFEGEGEKAKKHKHLILSATIATAPCCTPYTHISTSTLDMGGKEMLFLLLFLVFFSSSSH